MKYILIKGIFIFKSATITAVDFIPKGTVFERLETEWYNQPDLPKNVTYRIKDGEDGIKYMSFSQQSVECNDEYFELIN